MSNQEKILFLKRYVWLDREINRKMAEIEQWRSRLGKVTAVPSSQPGGGILHRSNGTNDRGAGGADMPAAGEEVDQVAQIPREVWRFCVEQIKLYPLTEIAYQNATLDIQACCDDAGYSGPPDQSGVVVHSGVAPQVARLEAKQEALNNPHYRYLARSVAIMETAKRLDGGEILDAIWQVGWRDNVLIGLHANISTRSVARAKHELISRIAVGWGLW